MIGRLASQRSLDHAYRLGLKLGTALSRRGARGRSLEQIRGAWDEWLSEIDRGVSDGLKAGKR